MNSDEIKKQRICEICNVKLSKKNNTKGYKSKCDRCSNKESYYKNRDKALIRMRKYSNENKEKRRETQIKCIKKNPEKYRKIARDWQKKNYNEDEEYRKKMLITSSSRSKYKKEKCSKCGSDKNLQLHHYTKPYKVDKVIVLCRKCHRRIHNGK